MPISNLQTDSVVDLFSNKTLSLIKRPSKIKFNPDVKYYQNYRYFAMQASIEITKKGRIWSCWIGGEDGSGAYVIATYSDDNGKTFKDIQFVVDPHDETLPMIMNAHIGCFWQDPKGRLWLFYQQSFGMWDGQGANFAIVCDDPDADNPVWSEPKYISIGASLKKPIVASNGEWILPVSIWERWHISPPLTDCHKDLDYIRGARFYASTNDGESWEYRGGVEFLDSEFNEHSLVQLNDGRLMMYSRCKNAIKKSYSSDGARTWTDEEIAFPHVGSLAMIRTLPSGNILLIKHGEGFDVATPNRCDLTAYVSTDDGKTYKGGLLLDERSSVSYPDIAIASDGRIFVQYDLNRTTDAQILFARFNEQDVLDKAFNSKDSGTKFIIKDTDGIIGHPARFPETEPFTGEGTKNDPYVIDTAKKWNMIARSVEGGETFLGKYFIQTKDIDFGEDNISPIGYFLQFESHKRPFSGNYDGNGFILSNLRQDALELYGRALFGYVKDGSVKNVSLKNAIFKGKTNTASIVGYALGEDNVVEILNCKNSEVEILSYEWCGGIVGRAIGKVKIDNCINSASITVPHSAEGRTVFAGGIVGYAEGKVEITNSVNHGDITVKYGSKVCAGEICGNNNDWVLKNAKSDGNLNVIGAVGEVIINQNI